MGRTKRLVPTNLRRPSAHRAPLPPPVRAEPACFLLLPSLCLMRLQSFSAFDLPAPLSGAGQGPVFREYRPTIYSLAAHTHPTPHVLLKHATRWTYDPRSKDLPPTCRHVDKNKTQAENPQNTPIRLRPHTYSHHLASRYGRREGSAIIGAALSVLPPALMLIPPEKGASSACARISAVPCGFHTCEPGGEK